VLARGLLADTVPGVHNVPKEIDAEVARLKLASMSIGLDTLTGSRRVPLLMAAWFVGASHMADEYRSRSSSTIRSTATRSASGCARSSWTTRSRPPRRSGHGDRNGSQVLLYASSEADARTASQS